METKHHWIENVCRYPAGPERGHNVLLTGAQRNLVRRIYDDDGASAPITGPLAAYLTAGSSTTAIAAILQVGRALPVYPQLQTRRCTALTDAMGHQTQT